MEFSSEEESCSYLVVRLAFLHMEMMSLVSRLNKTYISINDINKFYSNILTSKSGWIKRVAEESFRGVLIPSEIKLFF